MHDYTRADLDPQTRGMLDFAVQMTREPTSMNEFNVQGLCDLGLSDEQMMSVVLITCMFNFMTRLASELGVELASGRREAIERWLRGLAVQREWLMRPIG